MLDPISTLGFAANILQLIDFSTKVVLETRGFVRSSGDALPSNEALESLTKQNQQLFVRISGITGKEQPLTESENAVYDVALRCSKAATSLLEDVDALKIKRSSNNVITYMHALRQSLRTVTRREKLETRSKELRDLQMQLGNALLHLLLQRQDAGLEEIKTWLQSQNAGFGELKSWLQSQNMPSTADITGMNNEMHRLLAQINQGLKDRERRPQRIIDSLRFGEMGDRRAAIPYAHQKSFEWAFDEADSPYLRWLESGERVFWVSGKAGSGKSTFMKFVTDDIRTTQALTRWAKGDTLIVAQHYFWYAGTPLQQSHQGLLQSLLYQILVCDHEQRMFPVICASRWSSQTLAAGPWSRDELLASIRSVRQLKNIKLCVFIDGLDEYRPHSDHRKLIADLESLASARKVKVCVSSRPWNDFEQAFGQDFDRLRLERFTRADIVCYSRDRIESTVKAVTNEPLPRSSKESLSDLTQQIATKAHGVFLWVTLVVSTVEEHLAAGESLEKVQQYVELYPEELENYFRIFIYNRIHKTWRIQTAQALRMASLTARFNPIMANPGAWEGPLGSLSRGVTRRTSPFRSLSAYWLLSEGIEDPNFHLSYEIQRFSVVECKKMMSNTKKYLNACCKDLLAVVEDTNNWETPSDSSEAYRNPMRSYHVEFLHRTVYDFLMSEDMQSTLDKYTPTHFRDDDFLFRITVALSKAWICQAGDFCDEFADCARSMLPWRPPQSEGERKKLMLSLKELDRVGGLHTKELCDGDCCMIPSRDESVQQICAVQQQLVAYQHHSYTTNVINKQSMLFAGFEDCPLLVPALGYSAIRSFALKDIDEDFVSFLLRRGAKPNHIVPKALALDGSAGLTLWTRFLLSWIKELSRMDEAGNEKAWRVAKLLIQYGAEIEAEFFVGQGPESDANTISGVKSVRMALELCVPEKCSEDLHATLKNQQIESHDHLRGYAT